MSERDARQFVVRVLDVAQGAGALLQVDDQPPRWLGKDDVLAVSTTGPPVPPADVALLTAQEDLEQREGMLGRVMKLAHALWSPDRGLRESLPGWIFAPGAQWPDVIRWVSAQPKPDPIQEDDRWAGFADDEVCVLLTDKKRLSAALGHLDNKQLGVVLGSALKQLDDRGDSTLPTLLRALADRVERLERRGGE